MMRQLIPLLIAFTVCSCNRDKAPALQPRSDFNYWCDGLVLNLWRAFPGWGTSVGFHKYDGILSIDNEAGRNFTLAFSDSVTEELRAFDYNALNAADKVDYRLIENWLQSTTFYIRKFKAYEWDPSSFNVGAVLDATLNHNQLPLEARLDFLEKRIEQVPAYYEAAARNLRKVSLPHTRLAVSQNKGLDYFFDTVIPDSLKASAFSTERKNLFLQKIGFAQKAVHNYISFLETDKLNQAEAADGSSPRIGAELYREKFALEIAGINTAEEVFQKAMKRKQELHTAMTAISRQLWPKYFGNRSMPHDSLQLIREMIDTLSARHCKRDEFIATIRNQLPQLEKFIAEHKLIDLDSTQPLEVRETPAYQAGVAGAGIVAPGPYDPKAPTYYNVTPLTNYSAADAESYLREYNQYVLQILNIHEAIPGHYTQLVYANRAPSMIKSILGNGAMIEGWACYAELMMMEAGYDNSPEMWLFYYKWNLRETTNMILDYKIHAENMSESEAMQLLVNEAFQQTAEAKEKYKRALLTSVQLSSYFAGLSEILELREQQRSKLGTTFRLKAFHEKFLSYGSAPVSHIRTMME